MLLNACGESNSNNTIASLTTPSTSEPLDLLRSVTFNTIFFDLQINNQPYRGDLQEGQRFPIGSGSTVDLQIPASTLPNGSHQIRVEYCHIAAGSSNCRPIAILEQTILISDNSSPVVLSTQNFSYPDRDGNDRMDIFDITIDAFIASVQEQNYSRVRLNTEGYKNGFGPDMDVLTGSKIVDELNNVYGYNNNLPQAADARQLQIVQPQTLDNTEVWNFGEVPPGGDFVEGLNQVKTPYYLFDISASNGICTGELGPFSASSIRSNARAGLNRGILLMLFRKEGSEYLVPMTEGIVNDLSIYKIGNSFDDTFLDVELDLNDSLVAVIAPLGTVGWFTVWQDAGNEDTSPNCSFNITSPPLVSDES